MDVLTVAMAMAMATLTSKSSAAVSDEIEPPALFVERWSNSCWVGVTCDRGCRWCDVYTRVLAA